jgi:hypothetical protein
MVPADHHWFGNRGSVRCSREPEVRFPPSTGTTLRLSPCRLRARPQQFHLARATTQPQMVRPSPPPRSPACQARLRHCRTTCLSSDPVFAMPGDPASRKCNIADPDTGNDSPIKRAQSSEGGSAFSFSTRMQLEKLYGTACWHCSSLFAYNAHVIAQADKSLANSMEVGLVNLQGHRDVNNALRLCPNCHVAYDDPDPKLIIVPYDLAFFKEAEERWQENYRITRAARPPLDCDTANTAFLSIRLSTTTLAIYSGMTEP